MTRLVELQPEPFAEISLELAAALGVASGDPIVVETARGAVRLKALVTGRVRPVPCGDSAVEIVWAPMHYGGLPGRRPTTLIWGAPG